MGAGPGFQGAPEGSCESPSDLRRSACAFHPQAVFGRVSGFFPPCTGGAAVFVALAAALFGAVFVWDGPVLAAGFGPVAD